MNNAAIDTIGFIGLGRMGANVVLNLLEKKHKVVVYNRTPDKVRELMKEGAHGAFSLQELTHQLPSPRVLILMITAGKPVDEVLTELIPLLNKEDIVIEAGNSFFEDSIRRHALVKKQGIHFLDMGTSGGLGGARHGASLTIGGEERIFRLVEPLFADIATKDGYAYMGPAGAGHFVKMVHNGIEYALLEAYAEGFEVLKKSDYKLDFEQVAKVWSHGSIIRSYLTELAQQVFSRDPHLNGFKGVIGGGETGKWTLDVASRQNVEMETLAHAMQKRKDSEKSQSFSTKVVAALRNEFGGHVEPTKEHASKE